MNYMEIVNLGELRNLVDIFENQLNEKSRRMGDKRVAA